MTALAAALIDNNTHKSIYPSSFTLAHLPSLLSFPFPIPSNSYPIPSNFPPLLSLSFIPPFLLLLDLGEVEDMQDDLADLFEDMTEINDIMGTQGSNDVDP